MMGNGYGMAGMWLLWLWGLLILAGIGYLVIATATDHRRRNPRPDGWPDHPPHPTAAAPRELLNQRYARGELTTEEYTERLRVLTENTER